VSARWPRLLRIWMESVRLFSPSSRERRSVGSARLGFLGLWPFGRGNPRLWGWKGLDFLGFSRPNRAFSMGYAGFSLKEISRAFCRRARTGTAAHDFCLRRGKDWSSGKRNSISAFLQEIAVRTVSLWPPPSKRNSSRNASDHCSARGHCIVLPPSSMRLAPLIIAAASLARKSAVSATSLG
jgi:hypothetical protein